ncbi:MAG: coproporphyrinogen dehydrogenase HemZ [Firmicutes bacterium HGW-Firmicutes-12]|nr:MAG: coproporphyrinogen dehydrogenase HemZ [Firmicutes bacterium HGW-Firmicutes-12]
MIDICIKSDEPSDLKVLHDLLKAHFPGAKLQHLYLTDQDRPIILDKSNPNLFVLEVKRQDISENLEISLRNKDNEYKHIEYFRSESFQEEAINRRRRLLRLAVYRLLCENYTDICKSLTSSEDIQDHWGLSPWGVLTGVRPTKIVHRLIEQGLPKERILSLLELDYGIRYDKACLLYKTALYQLPYIIKKTDTTKRVSIYICIPFCPTRCHYCSFPSFSLQKWGYLLDEYIEGLEREISVIGEFLQKADFSVHEIYLGGGTPTLLSALQLERVLKASAQAFPLEEDCEITVEGGRPDTLNYSKLKTLRDNNVNRLCINPQTMCEQTLQVIGRKHTPADIIENYKLAKEIGIPIINMDLIIGLQGENRYILKQTLDAVLNLHPENITLHALAIKRAALYRQESIKIPAWTEGQAMMELAHESMERAGYIPYYLYRQKDILAHGENVGYTLDGFACRYNIHMMEERQTVLGFGVGAGSKILNLQHGGIDNVYNPKDLVLYLNRLEEIITKKVDKLKGIVYNDF